MKIYEVGYLLVPELATDAVAEEVGKLKAFLFDTLGGMEISSEMPRPIELAYEMEKRIGGKKEWYGRAYFGWIKFEISPDDIGKLKSELGKNNKFIRFIIMKTVRENTMIAKKVLARPAEGARKRAETPEAPAMTEEELDKTIENLVIE